MDFPGIRSKASATPWRIYSSENGKKDKEGKKDIAGSEETGKMTGRGIDLGKSSYNAVSLSLSQNTEENWLLWFHCLVS